MKKKKNLHKGKRSTIPLVVDEDSRESTPYEHARQRALRHLENPPDLGTFGKITWTRDELHERHPEKKAK